MKPWPRLEERVTFKECLQSRIGAQRRDEEVACKAEIRMSVWFLIAETG